MQLLFVGWLIVRQIDAHAVLRRPLRKRAILPANNVTTPCWLYDKAQQYGGQGSCYSNALNFFLGLICPARTGSQDIKNKIPLKIK